MVRTIAQTTDGYLWLGTDSGLIRFDGVQMSSWTPPPGQQLPGSPIQALLGARDGTLWIATFGGLASWKNGQLTQYPVLSRNVVAALVEDRDGTVWATGWGSPSGKGRLYAFRNGAATCYGDDGILGSAASSLAEDAEGELWVGAASGLWRWKPGPPARYAADAFPVVMIRGLTQGKGGSGLIFVTGRGIRQIAGGKVADYPLPGAPSPLTEGRLLRDRHGALWIGTFHGLIYSFQGRTRLITHSEGRSSDRVFAIFEDREGTIWAGTSDGLDSFRDLPLASLSMTDGLSSSATAAVLAARDGSIWIGSTNGLNRWRDGRTKIYRTQTDPGLPGNEIETLFEDDRGRIWVSGSNKLAVFRG